MISRRAVHTVSILALLILLALAAWSWWYVSTGRYPLAGSLHHNYGIVPIQGRSAGAEHTFELRNRTGQTINIEKIIPGCGCADVEPTTMTIPPGERVDIRVTLTLSHTGEKKTHVTLILENLEPLKLWIRGTGRKELSLWTGQRRLGLTPGEPTPLIVIAEILSQEDEPQIPDAAAPDGVAVSFQRWERVEQREVRKGWAAKWRGHFTVEISGDELPQPAQLTISLGKANTPPITLHLAHNPVETPKKEPIDGESLPSRPAPITDG